MDREGDDFLALAAQARQLGLPEPYISAAAPWWAARTLGAWRGPGKVVLQPQVYRFVRIWMPSDRCHGCAAFKLGRWIEQRICHELRHLAIKIADRHPRQHRSCRDRQSPPFKALMTILLHHLGFEIAPTITAPAVLCPVADLKSRISLYAAGDPFFHPAIAPELDAIAQHNPVLDFEITRHGGHVGYWQGRDALVGDRSIQGWLEDSGTLNQRWVDWRYSCPESHYDRPDPQLSNGSLNATQFGDWSPAQSGVAATSRSAATGQHAA
ncbi:hypothetical protein [Synechococcus elongatus]|uniref:hypothetical protein n=1 Tax=Synechococcus elongatus TaxID=32046 RepID=UPI0030CBF717